MARSITKQHFKGIIPSTRTKEFLVDSARTGLVETLRIDVVDDSYDWDKNQPTIFDDNEKNGVEISIWVYMKERENETKPRLQDNPVVKKFAEKYSLYMA